MNKEVKRALGKIGSYMIVYITMLICVESEFYTFQNMILLALSYIVVDVTMILIKLDVRKNDND